VPTGIKHGTTTLPIHPCKKKQRIMTGTFSHTPARAGRGWIRQYLDQGVHPASRAPLLSADLLNPPAVCGGCAHAILQELGGDKEPRERLKCGLLPRGGRRMRGPDLSDNTPACSKYTASVAPQLDT